MFYIFRWNKSVWTKFGLNCAFWLVPLRQTNTLWSKVGSFKQRLSIICCIMFTVQHVAVCAAHVFICPFALRETSVVLSRISYWLN